MNYSNWKISPEQREKNYALKSAWRQEQRKQEYAARAVGLQERNQATINNLLKDFSATKIPLANSLVKWRIAHGIYALIIGLQVDSYYMDCLQTIKKLSDTLETGTTDIDEDLKEKIGKLAIELDVEFDETSFIGSDNFIDDFLHALIIMRNAFSPDKKSDLYEEFDFLLKRYFPQSHSVQAENALRNWEQAVYAVPEFDPIGSAKHEMDTWLSDPSKDRFQNANNYALALGQEASRILKDGLERWKTQSNEVV